MERTGTISLFGPCLPSSFPFSWALRLLSADEQLFAAISGGALKSELLPHLKKNAFYLAQNSYEIVDKKGRLVSDGIVDRAIEEKLRSGDLRVRQKPGPENSLRLVIRYPQPIRCIHA